MSKSHKEWNALLKTIVPDQDFKLKKINEEEISLTFQNSEIFNKFNESIGSEIQLRSNISHALPQNESPKKVANNVLGINHFLMKDNDLYNFLKNIFSESFLKESEITQETWKKFVYDPVLKIATLSFEGAPHAIKRDVAKFEILQYALSVPEAIDIIKESLLLKFSTQNENASSNSFALLSKEYCTVSPLAEEVLNIKTNKEGTKGQVIINYGKILQEIQNDIYDNTTPVAKLVSQNEEIEITFKKEAFLKYLENIFGIGLLFQQSQDESLTPIMFASSIVENNPNSFHLLLDKSGSMEDNFNEYIIEVKKIIKKITSNVSKGKITITAFDENLYLKNFSIEDVKAVDKMFEFLDNLKADLQTNLNGAIISTLEDLSKFTDENNTIILFTDGRNNIEKYTKDDVSKVIQKFSLDPKFHMYTFGYGKEYDQDFFSNIASKNGFKHIHLSNAGELEEFSYYLQHAGTKVNLYEFMVGVGEHLIQRLQSGDVEIGPQIPKDNVIKIFKNGSSIEYFVGTYEQSKESEIVEDEIQDVENTNDKVIWSTKAYNYCKSFFVTNNLQQADNSSGTSSQLWTQTFNYFKSYFINQNPDENEVTSLGENEQE